MQPTAWVLVSVVGLPFLAAALVPAIYRVVGERTAYFAAAIAAVCFGLIATQFGAHGAVAIPWIPALDVSLSFYVDGLSLLIGFLASGIGVLVFVYSGEYMRAEPGKVRYYSTMLSFMGAMLGVAFAANLIVLYVFWELTSIASFLLIGHYQDEAGRDAARKSLVITVSGGLFMLVGFLLLHAVVSGAFGGGAVGSGRVGTGVPGVESAFRLAGEGSLLANADAVQAALQAQGMLVPVLLLIGIGVATKSAQVPFHIWLPDAMEAPTPVSTYLHAATMVQAGVYLLARMRPLLLTEEWVLLFAVLGLVTMAVTAVLAVGSTDIKELLAYSTASHLGLIVAGYGIASAAAPAIGLVGVQTGAFHILNHAVFKAALFLVAGIVAHEAGTRVLDDLGGLWRDLPITAAITVIAALGMAGVPPFNGFYSKELLFEATYMLADHAGGLWWLLPAIAVFGSVFTFLYSIRFLTLFFGDKPGSIGRVHRPSMAMLTPPAILAGLAALIGLGGITATFGVHLPFEAFVGRVVESSLPAGHLAEFSYHLPTQLTPAVVMSALAIGVGIVAYPSYDKIQDGIRRLTGLTTVRPNWYYTRSTDGLARSRLVDVVQTGPLRTALRWLLLSVSALALGGYLAVAVSMPEFATIGLTIPILVVLVVALVGAGAVTRAPSHVAGVLTLSILGFTVAIFYILADAPDLALTQLTVETLVLVIFLLVLDRLPEFYGELDRRTALADAVIAGIVGTTVTITVLLTTAASPDDVIAEFFLKYGGIPAEHGFILTDFGGGHNVVNVILVDFRAFDTMGEISVIAMAALSVITVIAMRERGETQ